MKVKHKSVSYAKYGYIFCIPFVLAFLVFTLYPIGFTALIGFTDLRGVATADFNILWDDPFANFRTAINAPTFQTALINTPRIWILNFIPQLGLALLLTAWFTNDMLRIKGKGAFKVIFYMPNIITAASIAVLFGAIFAHPIGPLNYVLVELGITEAPIAFFEARPWTMRLAVAFIQFWMWYGVTMIILIAGVMGISPTLFEAASIDGATGTQAFLYITIPCLRTILLYVLVTSMIGGLQMFDIPLLFVRGGNGGPDLATMTTSLFIYNQAFMGSYLFARAAAASMIMFAIIAVLSAILFYVMRDKDAARIKKERKLANLAEKARAQEQAQAKGAAAV
ncbi:MAG: sugar ABC transporter permease [Defluviitaleaceae bacterium]|nr:sugar ABC transporter permease [Defluviitaleaceae bacterium]